MAPDFLTRRSLCAEWIPGMDPFAILAGKSGRTREEELGEYCAKTGMPAIPVSLFSADENFVRDPLLPIVYAMAENAPVLTAFTPLPIDISRIDCGELAAKAGVRSLRFALLEYDDYLALLRVFSPPQTTPAEGGWDQCDNPSREFPCEFAEAALSADYPVLNSISIPADERVYGVVSAEAAEGFGVCPVALNAGNYVFACAKAVDRTTMATIRSRLPRDAGMQFVIVPPAALDVLLKNYSVAITARQFTRSGDDSVKDRSEINVHEISPSEIRESLKRSFGASNFTDALLLRGFQEDASDIHLSMVKRGLRIRLRVNGLLRDIQEENVPYELCQAVLSRIKILAGIDVQRKELPQDGQFKFRVSGKLCEVRVNSSETVEGPHIVMRLQMPNERLTRLESLGIDPYELGVIRQAINADNGMFVICGPTGSGKSTTLYAALEAVDRVRYKVISGEQPVERKIANVEQTHIRKGSEYTFSEFVVAAMRQDPDYILIGETRDAETAREIVRAAITGHVVLTTLHTNTAAMAPVRLADLTGEPFLIADALTALCSQRLLPKLCPYCKEPVPIPAASRLSEMGIRREWIADGGFARSRGCQHCHFTGSASRICVMEAFLVNAEIRDMIARRASSRDIANAQRKLGSAGLYEKAVRRAASGEVALSDVLPLKMCGL